MKIFGAFLIAATLAVFGCMGCSVSSGPPGSRNAGELAQSDIGVQGNGNVQPVLIHWPATTNGATITQDTTSTLVQGQDLAIIPQQSSFAGDAGGGNLVVTFQTPVGTAPGEGAIVAKRGSTAEAALGPIGTSGCIWVGSDAVTRKSTSAALCGWGNDAGLVVGTGATGLNVAAPIGGSDAAVAWANGTIPVDAGTVTLSGAQASTPYLVLSGSLTGDVTIVLPATLGATWYVDATGVTVNGHKVAVSANSVQFTDAGITVASVYQFTYGGTGKLYGTPLTP